MLTLFISLWIISPCLYSRASLLEVVSFFHLWSSLQSTKNQGSQILSLVFVHAIKGPDYVRVISTLSPAKRKNEEDDLYHSSSLHGLLSFVDRGLIFTKLSGSTNIRERLDRAVASPDWQALFPNLQLFHLPTVSSHHAPLQPDTNPLPIGNLKPFKFASFWEKEPLSFYVVQQAWRARLLASAGSILSKNLKATKRAFRR